MAQYYAHSGRDTSPDRSDWQLLREHLLAVALGAQQRGSPIEIRGRSLGAAAYATGLFHDLGKYRDGFQCRIRGLPSSGGKRSTYHKQAGAAKAWEGKQFATAFAVAGHHGGIPSLDEVRTAVRSDEGSVAVAKLWPEAVADCPELEQTAWPKLELGDRRDGDRLLFDLETRLLFSCLVDSDWADTSEHDRRVKGWPNEPTPPELTSELAQAWLKNVLAAISARADKCRSAEVARARSDVLNAALEKAGESPGFFTLEVPTGGGKTLSGLAFALGHVATNHLHRLRRIIYVAPYLSILDQNGRVIREALGVGRDAPEVFEHHSLNDPDEDTQEGDEQQEERRAAAARRAENWDAPVVITTNVQFFESLFSNEPGRCRKLHNIARSVIVLDECQAIPKELFAPTCAMLGQLVEHLRCTIVLATATQPAFDHEELHKHGSGFTNVRPIVSSDLGLFNRLRRVRVEWPGPGEYLDWTDVARLMTEQTPASRPAALCVVNTRRAARELFETLRSRCEPGSVFHLSTWMCPAHRLEVLATVRARLEGGLPCYLISTQLIEAGVDVDFPLVLRELAPLDAIIQAAGRANREGLLNAPDGSPGGRVIVFRSRAARNDPARYYPPDPWYEAGRDVLGDFFLGKGDPPSIDDPEVINSYFKHLLNVKEIDSPGIRKLREAWDFPGVARLYRVIKESGEPVVVASWKEHRDEIARGLDALRECPTRQAFRALARYQVNLRFPTGTQRTFVQEGPHGTAIWLGGYDPNTGLGEELLVDQTICWDE
jgi:CRISPR-associated endonuclease/helicase Cas3